MICILLYWLHLLVDILNSGIMFSYWDAVARSWLYGRHTLVSVTSMLWNRNTRVDAIVIVGVFYCNIQNIPLELLHILCVYLHSIRVDCVCWFLLSSFNGAILTCFFPALVLLVAIIPPYSSSEINLTTLAGWGDWSPVLSLFTSGYTNKFYSLLTKRVSLYEPQYKHLLFN